MLILSYIFYAYFVFSAISKIYIFYSISIIQKLFVLYILMYMRPFGLFFKIMYNSFKVHLITLLIHEPMNASSHVGDTTFIHMSGWDIIWFIEITCWQSTGNGKMHMKHDQNDSSDNEIWMIVYMWALWVISWEHLLAPE